MVVSREDTSMTPAGMTFSHAGGHRRRRFADPRRDGRGQVLSDQPEVHLRRRRFQARRVDVIRAERRRCPTNFKAVANREGDPDLIDSIADERNVTSVDELLAWLEEHNHPAMAMEAIF